MINFYTSDNGRLDQIEEIESGCWVSVIDPTPQEIKMLIDDYGLDSGFVKSSLDEEESSRIEREDDQTLIIIDTPVASTDEDETKMFPGGVVLSGMGKSRGFKIDASMKEPDEADMPPAKPAARRRSR